MKKFLRLGEKISNVSICGNDITKFSILIDGNLAGIKAPPCDCLPYIAKAASVMQDYIFKVTDVRIPILYHNFPLKTDYEIRIGNTNRNDFEGALFKDDDFHIKTVFGNVCIGGGKRGVLYGVYTFIEKYLGVRFFTKECERILYRPKIEIGDIDMFHDTVLEYRELCCWTGWDPDFSVKSKINGNFVRKLREEDGGSVGFAGGFAGLCHTFGHLVPIELFKEHPEYFALNEDGKRDPSGLCLRNANTFKVALKSAKAWLKKEKDPTLISVSVNDGNVAYCRCEKCRKIIEKGGNDTDNLFYFVNKMQRSLEKIYPKITVDTLAYGKVAVPPKKIKPDKNVMVRLCGGHIRNVPFIDTIKRFESGEKILEGDANYVKRVKKWGKICNKISVWDYPYYYRVINTPFPVFGTLLKNTRFFVDNHAKGMYINGQTECAEFTELKFYVQAKVMFDPFMTEEEYNNHVEEFLEGYYGAGWKYILKFIKLCEKTVKYSSAAREPIENIPLPKRKDGSYDETFIVKSNGLFKKAYDAALTDGEKRRVRKSWLQVEYFDLYSLMDIKMANATESEKAALIERNKNLYNELRNLGITRIGERTFMPVVKNFAQSPFEHVYWDFKSIVGDRNNETYEREVYVMIPVDLPEGTKTDISFLYRTNNENESGYLGFYADGKINDTDINPCWHLDGQYREISFKQAEVASVYTVAEKLGLPLNGLMLAFLPRHLFGVVLRVKAMDAGGYLFVRSPRSMQVD